jgi:hypothetical protein
MTGPADLVVVSSPLQYMNAVEWRRRTAGRHADLVLIGDRAGGDAAIAELMLRDPGLWRAIHRHPGRPRLPRWLPASLRDAADAQHRAGLERLARSLSRPGYRRLVFGDYRNASQRALVAKIPHRDLILVDDGSVTPQVARFRAGRADTPEPERFRLNWFRTSVGRALFGDEKLADPDRLTFFTIYGRLIDRTLAPGDRILAHAFEGWRAAAGSRAPGDEIWLLGANHVEARIASAADYRRLILSGVAALRAEGFGGPILYRPHRGEDPAAARRLAAAAGLQLAPGTLPVEAVLLEAERRPAAVLVVASSAADTLAVIDPEVPIVRLDLPAGYLRRQRDHILAVVAAHDAFNPRLRVLRTAPPSAETRSAP